MAQIQLNIWIMSVFYLPSSLVQITSEYFTWVGHLKGKKYLLMAIAISHDPSIVRSNIKMCCCITFCVQILINAITTKTSAQETKMSHISERNTYFYIHSRTMSKSMYFMYPQLIRLGLLLTLRHWIFQANFNDRVRAWIETDFLSKMYSKCTSI